MNIVTACVELTSTNLSNPRVFKHNYLVSEWSFFFDQGPSSRWLQLSLDSMLEIPGNPMHLPGFRLSTPNLWWPLAQRRPVLVRIIGEAGDFEMSSATILRRWAELGKSPSVGVDLEWWVNVPSCRRLWAAMDWQWAQMATHQGSNKCQGDCMFRGTASWNSMIYLQVFVYVYVLIIIIIVVLLLLTTITIIVYYSSFFDLQNSFRMFKTPVKQRPHLWRPQALRDPHEARQQALLSLKAWNHSRLIRLMDVENKSW
jgi:hypothetical protein